MIKDIKDENLDFYIAQLNEYIKDDETEDNVFVDSVLDFYFDNSDDDDDNCTIFVGNLPDNEILNGIQLSYDNQYLDESFIRKFFENYSISNEPGSIKIKRKAISFGFHYSYAFVKFESKEQAQLAIKQLNYTKIFEKEICLIPYDQETKNILRSNQNCLLIKILPIEKSFIFDLFTEFGEIIYCHTYQPFLKKDNSIYTCVQFRRQADFEKAMQGMEGVKINDIPIEIKQFFPFKNKKDQNQTQRYRIFYKTPNLIEYSAFYGSIKVFNYLYQKSNILLTPSLWLYAIHGRNPEIIADFLECKNIDFPKGKNGVYCLKESIKCHHKEISDYILMIDKDKDKYRDKIIRYGYHYYNYNFYSNDFSNYNICKYAAKYDHFSIVHFLLEIQKYISSSSLVNAFF